MRLNGSAAVD